MRPQSRRYVDDFVCVLGIKKGIVPPWAEGGQAGWERPSEGGIKGLVDSRGHYPHWHVVYSLKKKTRRALVILLCGDIIIFNLNTNFNFLNTESRTWTMSATIYASSTNICFDKIPLIPDCIIWHYKNNNSETQTVPFRLLNCAHPNQTHEQLNWSDSLERSHPNLAEEDRFYWTIIGAYPKSLRLKVNNHRMGTIHIWIFVNNS